MRICLRLSDGAQGDSMKVATLTDADFWIGRATECDWCIVDDRCALSRRHCTLALRDGEVVLTDYSSHGTAVGSMHSRLVCEQPTPIRGHTVLYLANSVRIDVTIGDTAPVDEEDKDFWRIDLVEGETGSRTEPGFDASPPGGGAGEVDPDDPLGMRDFDADIDAGPPRGDPAAMPDPFGADPFSAAAPPPPKPVRRAPAPAPAPAPEPERRDRAGAALPAREDTLAAGAPPQAPPSPPPSASGDQDSETVNALLRAAGVDPGALTPARRREMALEIGRCFEVGVAALHDLLALRNQVKSALGLGGTRYETSANPLKIAETGEEAGRMLLLPDSGGALGAVAAMDEAHRDLRQHQLALVGGVRGGVKAALDAFDPEKLKAKAPAQSLDTVMPFRRDAALWNHFVGNYRSFAEEANDDVRRVLRTELDRLYNGQDRWGG